MTMKGKRLGSPRMAQRQSVTTISDFLVGGQSGRFGTLVDTEDNRRLPISFARDASQIGIYNIVLKSPDGRQSQRIRMQLKGGESLKEAQRYVQDYFNVDNPGRFKLEAIEIKPVKASPMRKPVKTGHPADTPLKARLAELKKIRFKSFGQEREIAHLEQLIKADPDKFKTGEGVAWKIYGQTNRGFRVIQVFPERKEAVIGLVRDTGFADINVGHREVVHVGDLVRDRKYDA